MAKYEPLVRYLRRQKAAEVELSFRDIERIVGGLLPKASADLKWWRVEDSPSALPQQRAFAAAGYAPEPELRAERVRFVRMISLTPRVQDIQLESKSMSDRGVADDLLRGDGHARPDVEIL